MALKFDFYYHFDLEGPQGAMALEPISRLLIFIPILIAIVIPPEATHFLA